MLRSTNADQAGARARANYDPPGSAGTQPTVSIFPLVSLFALTTFEGCDNYNHKRLTRVDRKPRLNL
eukprot:3963191-Pyramimonas_sp.AAC.1